METVGTYVGSIALFSAVADGTANWVGSRTVVEEQLIEEGLALAGDAGLIWPSAAVASRS